MKYVLRLDPPEGLEVGVFAKLAVGLPLRVGKWIWGVVEEALIVDDFILVKVSTNDV